MGALNRVVQRQGFHTVVKTSPKWKQVRLDLRRFDNMGEVSWEEVRSLKIIHMPGGEARVVVDDIYLEKE